MSLKELNDDVISGPERPLATEIDILPLWAIEKYPYNLRVVHARLETCTEHK